MSTALQEARLEREPRPSGALRRRTQAALRRRAEELAQSGAWRDAIDLQRALLQAARRAPARAQLADRFRLFRWLLVHGAWSDALELSETIYARLVRRDAALGPAAAWLSLARAICQYHLGMGSRFRRSLARVLREARRTRAPGLLEAALRVLDSYAALRSGVAPRSRRARHASGSISGRPLLAEPWRLPHGEPHPRWLTRTGCHLWSQARDGALSWSRLPELMPIAGSALDPLLLVALPADGVAGAPWSESSSDAPREAALERWLERVETGMQVSLRVWAAPLLARFAREVGPELPGPLRERLHGALSLLAARRDDAALRAELFEAQSDLALWLVDGDGVAASSAALAQARADLAVATGLLRRLGFDTRADAAEARWSRLGVRDPRGSGGHGAAGRVGEFTAAPSRAPSATGLVSHGGMAALQARLADAGFLTRDVRLLRELMPLGLLAGTALPVLVLGESGTGKEVIARALHRWSGLRGECVPIHCGAIPRDLLESELFGHARGSFTGAAWDKQGLVEAADGGSLFLDEIGEMGPEAQMKLLRVLESGEVRRVGEVKPREARVRLIAATHRDLQALVDAGQFRLDLFHRIRGVQVRLRPLRERRQDIPEIAAAVMKDAARAGGGALRLSTAALGALCAHAWPGNVRELRAVLMRAAHLARALGRDQLEPELLGLRRDGDPPVILDEPVLPVPRTSEFDEAALPPPTGSVDLELLLSEMERRLILRALERHGWNRTRAAESLGGLSRTTLLSKMKRLGIEVPSGAAAGEVGETA